MKEKNIFDFEFLRFSIDTFDVFADFVDYSIFEGMDFENSNERLFYYKKLQFKISKQEAPNYKFKILFNYKGSNVFAYYHGKQISCYQKSRNRFLFYGQFFYLEGFNYSWILDFIKDNLLFYNIRRFDICLDILRSINWAFVNQNELSLDKKTGQINTKSGNPGSLIFGRSGKLQGMYFGEVRDSKNKNFLLRVYDKKVDIKDNHKEHMLPEYLTLDSVVRYELEIRQNYAKNVSLLDLDSSEYIKNLFYTYFSKVTDVFNNFLVENIKIGKMYKKVSVSDVFTEDLFSDRFLAMFKGYAKKMLSLGHCPTDFLIEYGLYQDKTIESIPKFVVDNKFDRLLYSIRDK